MTLARRPLKLSNFERIYPSTDRSVHIHQQYTISVDLKEVDIELVKGSNVGRNFLWKGLIHITARLLRIFTVLVLLGANGIDYIANVIPIIHS